MAFIKDSQQHLQIKDWHKPSGVQFSLKVFNGIALAAILDNDCHPR